MTEAGVRILLIRHATTAKVGKSLTGWLPGIALDEPGRAQAAKLVDRLRNIPVGQIWSSPLERALETAQPLASDRGLKTLRNPDLGEVNFGNWQGCSLASLQDDAEFGRFNTYRSGTRAPGGELMLETQARMVRGLLRIAAETQDNTGQYTAIFSHADAIKCAVMHALGIPIDFHYRLEIEPASVTELHLFPDIVRVLRVNILGSI